MNMPYANYRQNPAAKRLYIYFSARNRKLGTFDLYPIPPGVDASVLCVNCQNDWYHNGVPGLGDNLNETLLAIRRIIDESGAETVVTVGSSMGAFGAVFYGCKIGADAVVAFGPELIINVRGGFSAKNMAGSSNILRMEDIDRTDRTRLFYVCGDMSPVDNYCAVVASDRIGGTHVLIRDALHGVAKNLKNEGRLAEVIEECVTGRMASSEDAALAKRIFSGAQKLEDAHLIAYVESIGVKNRARGPLLGMANLLLGNKCFSAANQIAVMIEKAHGPCAESRYVLGWSSWKLRRVDAAFEHLLASVAIDPQHYRSQYSLATMFESKGRVSDALRHCEAALNAANTPTLEKFRKTCSEMKDRLVNL